MVTGRTLGALALALVVSLLLAANAAAQDFPVTVTTASGTVTLAAKPVRIVSLSPTATEDLFAIGAGKQVVAVDDQSNYPASAPRTKLSGYTPNVEAIAAYKPDLVVVSADGERLVEALGKLQDPGAPRAAGADARRRVRADPRSSARRPGTRAGGGGARRRG